MAQQSKGRTKMTAKSRGKESADFKSHITTNHEEIRQWVEERGGHPATVKRTMESGDEPGLLRIDFPDFTGEESLEEITWEDFFEKFDEKELAFLYQEKTQDGKQSRFSKIISRETSEEDAEDEEESGETE
jgi:hypothetical protein